ncbi:MAG: hypothetical protein FWG70_00905 [Oscillospiraceae bacterium]|nr:hypothetical protein [Oscillospiraceae bacterium]
MKKRLNGGIAVKSSLGNEVMSMTWLEFLTLALVVCNVIHLMQSDNKKRK